MAEHSTEALLRRLSRDVAPVRPLPSLRRLSLLLLAVLGGVLALEAAVAGGPAGLVAGAPWSSGASLLLLAGLALAAAGAAGGALAGAVPGREREARAARALAGLGLLVATGGALAWLRQAAAEPELPWASSLGCAARSLLLGLAPGALLLGFLAWGCEPRPRRGALLATGAAAAAGATLVHASCSDSGALHVVLGHCAVPLALAALAALPLGALLARARRTA